MIGKNDIADFRIDYKKNDWIRAIIDLKNDHSIVVHWDYISRHDAESFEDDETSAEDSHHVEESWTHTYGGEYCRPLTSTSECTDQLPALFIIFPALSRKFRRLQLP